MTINIDTDWDIDIGDFSDEDIVELIEEYLTRYSDVSNLSSYKKDRYVKLKDRLKDHFKFTNNPNMIDLKDYNITLKSVADELSFKEYLKNFKR